MEKVLAIRPTVSSWLVLTYGGNFLLHGSLGGGQLSQLSHQVIEILFELVLSGSAMSHIVLNVLDAPGNIQFEFSITHG